MSFYDMALLVSINLKDKWGGKNNMMRECIISISVVIACTSFAFATDLGGYTFLKISGSDARAVVQTPEGKKQLVAPGNMLGEATITEIVVDRVVLEQSGTNGPTMLIVKVKNDRQQVSRLQKGLVKQKTVTVDSSQNQKKFIQ